MTYGLATKSFLASEKGLAMGFIGLFTGSVTYLAMALHGSPPAAGPARTLTLVSAAEDYAVLGGDEGLRRVSVGSVLPGLGQIVRIERRDGRWTVVFANGKVLTKVKPPGTATGG